ncbi:hypothetical protein MTR67_002133 [Solanum verrucosum]|uniref:Uncharacterized protein n=1 Tax=Solanum verrucosum TaxID=315347 RepID=A0AAF0PPV1_SOLVR|nr:hypothetical protein MTR67_002133 [Solanum verrucosum]
MFTQKDLNPHQKIWLVLLKEYDTSALCHSGKTNVVADAHSPLLMSNVAHVNDCKKDLVCDVHRFSQLGFYLVDSNEGGVIVKNSSNSSLVSDVKVKQDLDLVMVDLVESVSKKTIEALS